MGKAMYELREMLNDELTKISKSGDLTASKLDIVDKLTHSIKSIDTICAMEEASGEEYDDYSMNYSEARGRGRNARRDSRGRYSREGGGGSSYRGGSSYEGGSSYARGGGYSRRGYSRDDGAKEEAMQKLQELMNETSDNSVRMAIQKAMDEMQ